MRNFRRAAPGGLQRAVHGSRSGRFLATRYLMSSSTFECSSLHVGAPVGRRPRLAATCVGAHRGPVAARISALSATNLEILRYPLFDVIVDIQMLLTIYRR